MARPTCVKLQSIVTGLLIGIVFLGASLAVSCYFSMSPLLILFPGVLLIGILYGAKVERGRRKFLQQFWARRCTGALWKRHFPKSTAPEIREFLDLFVSAFGFKSDRKLFFAPDDAVMEIYHGLYPDGAPDCMDLEELATSMRNTYGINVDIFWTAQTTLRELFARTRAAGRC